MTVDRQASADAGAAALHVEGELVRHLMEAARSVEDARVDGRERVGIIMVVG